MPANCFAHRPPEILFDEAVSRIHTAAVSLLADMGVRIACDEALDLLETYGVRCDRAEQRAYPTEEAVRRALGTVTRGYWLHPRTAGSDPLVISPETVHLISGAAALKLYGGGRYPDATREDLIDSIALHQGLDNIHILINLVEPPEMSGPNLYPEMAALHFCYSGKPLLLQADGRRDVEKLARMGSVLSGGRERLRERPLFMTGSNADLPLYIGSSAAEVLIAAAREGLPASLGPYGMQGSTTPLDVAGTIAVATAIVLTGLVLTQAAQPGSAYDFAASVGACDLPTGDVVTMSPAVMQTNAGLLRMGRHYGLVTQTLAATEAKCPDGQASAEKALSLANAVMCGANLIMGVTSEMSGMELADLAQCVIDDRIAGYVLEYAAGIDTDGLNEAVKAVEDVVTRREYADLKFLGHAHTAKHCHERDYRPGLFAAGQTARWVAARRPGLYQRAEERARELVGERKQFVSPDVRDELFSIADEA